MVRQFFVIRLRRRQDDDLRVWLNNLPAGSRSGAVRGLIRWALDRRDTSPPSGMPTNPVHPPGSPTAACGSRPPK